MITGRLGSRVKRIEIRMPVPKRHVITIQFVSADGEIVGTRRRPHVPGRCQPAGQPMTKALKNRIDRLEQNALPTIAVKTWQIVV